MLFSSTKLISVSAFLILAWTTHALAMAPRPNLFDISCNGAKEFMIGSGIYDITGPAAELGMMGYARVDQKTAGIHTRLWSRAFVVSSPCNSKRTVLVTADLGIVTQAIKQKVTERLQQRFGGIYNDKNVLISATHTHSGPGGFSHYALYNLTVMGYDETNFNAIVEGIVQSIARAHTNLAPATIMIARGDLLGASINRSSIAYAKNPANERGQYEFDTDKTMTVLKMERLDGSEIGTINWFPVHATSMGNDNLLISGDNKGYAAYLFEKLKGTGYTRPDTFVAAFAQGNEGDISPNIFGGTDGGGADDFESTEISGQKQFAKALALYEAASAPLVGSVDYRHTYVKLDAVTIAPDASTCVAAIGVSMLAGAEDGPGFGAEGATCQDVNDIIGGFMCEQMTTACQAEKPIVLETGAMTPFPWTPEVLPLQIITIGNLALVAVPFELTTMAGRRLRYTVATELKSVGIDTVVVAGLANAYAGYVATREEYAVQHYEGASTHFGPWTLSALRQEFARLGSALVKNEHADPGPQPTDLSCCQNSLITGVVFDDKPLFKNFGSVHVDAKTNYIRGQTVTVTYWGAHPRNDLKVQDTYLEVQRRTSGVWITVARDWDWSTKYRWRRILCFPTFACSHVTVEWTIPHDATPGSYRIRHHGHWKSGFDGSINPYTGTSRVFTIQ